MSDIVVHNAEHIISYHVNNVKEGYMSRMRLYHGFIDNINKQWFPLLSDKEIDDFKARYVDTVNKFFPKPHQQ